MKSLLKCILKKHYDRQLEADQNEFIETHYREVENMYQKMRGWRHDYHNHIQTLKFLAANNDIVGIREYLNELDTNGKLHGGCNFEQQSFTCKSTGNRCPR